MESDQLKSVDLEKTWTNHLRTRTRQERQKKGDSFNCPLCDKNIPQDLEQFRRHVQRDAAKHSSLGDDAAVVDAFRNMSLVSPRADAASKKRPVSGTQGDSEEQSTSELEQQGSPRQPKRLCSPPASVVQTHGSSPPTPSQTPRSRARQPPSRSDERPGRSRPSRSLYNPEGDNNRAKVPDQSQVIIDTAETRTLSAAENKEVEVFGVTVNPRRPHRGMLGQFRMEPITATQLVSEVKAIYHGLVLIEAKAVEVDNAQARFEKEVLRRDQWQALINLHRTLLYEHHDFFLASQHPASTAAMRKLSTKYAMPARMWRHAIHSFLELLRHRLPESYEFMLSYIYTAYGMMTLLYETIPAHKETWIECLGDLSRYRMAIEENDVGVREIWTAVSRGWYQLASSKMPSVGRLYHHMAILARPYALQQLFYYVKSLTVATPFASARESVMTLFDPLLEGAKVRYDVADAAFVRVHAIFFSGKAKEQLDDATAEYLGEIDGHIARTAKKWLENGYYTGIAAGCSLLGFGVESDFAMKAISQHDSKEEPTKKSSPSSDDGPSDTFKTSLRFTFQIYDIAVRRWADPNTLPFIHTIFVFVWFMTAHPKVMAHIEQEVPWKLTALMLNFHLKYRKEDLDFEKTILPAASVTNKPRPLPEDFALRELLYTEGYFPTGFFKGHDLEEIEKTFEYPSMEDIRKQRLLWLGREIAKSGKWLTWNPDSYSFGVAEEFSTGEDINLDVVQPTRREPSNVEDQGEEPSALAPFEREMDDVSDTEGTAETSQTDV